MTSNIQVTTETLRSLHRIHKQLDDLQERLERGPRIVRARQANFARMEEELAGLKKEALDLKIATDAKQVQLGGTEATVQKRRVQLHQAGDNREYQALKDEIAAVEAANGVMEVEILEAMEKLDQIHGKIEKAKATMAQAREEADEANAVIQEEEPRLQADVTRLQRTLKQFEAELPPDFRDVYGRVLKHRGEDAMAPVTGSFCGGCNQNIPLNMINDLMKSRPLACKSCGRLLYLPENFDPPG